MFETYQKYLQPELPLVPGARYAHILVLRTTESYAVFKTDGELNVARVQRGLTSPDLVSRVVLFKRKQTTPERLTGRELLRRYGIYEQIGKTCEYNSGPCGICPDCVIYGYAVGDSGSEKSKVYIDSAYSLTPYETSHETMTLNAPYEDGTMTKGTATTTRFSEQDHVLPGVYFPSVVTVRDPTALTLAYVLANIVRTKRYGAQTTRTGAVQNQILAVIFADGEIFSNLRLTQKSADLLSGQPPYPSSEVAAAVLKAAEELIKSDGVVYQFLREGELADLLAQAVPSEEAGVRGVLEALSAEALAYAGRTGVIKAK